MENKTTDINDLTELLAAIAMKPLLSNGVWQNYGYSKVPRKGSVWVKLFPKKFELENYITKEILIMGLIDVINAVKKSNKTGDTKLIISIGVIDQFLETTQHLFTPQSFMDSFFSAYASYSETDKSKHHEPIILKAKDVLRKEDFAKFMVGTIRLIGTQESEDFLLNTDYIKDQINSSSTDNKLSISMPEEMVLKYGDLLSEKILKSSVNLQLF